MTVRKLLGETSNIFIIIFRHKGRDAIFEVRAAAASLRPARYPGLVGRGGGRVAVMQRLSRCQQQRGGADGGSTLRN